MTSLTQDIQDKLKRLNIFEKIIILNIAIYVIGWLLARSNEVHRDFSLQWLTLPQDFSDFIFKPWSIITYGFAHVELWHLVMNMLVLYFVGRSLTNLFSKSISLNVYFLGIIFGGLLFLIFGLLLPNFISNKAFLLGASAGVHATLLFLCAYMPNHEVRLGSIRIKFLYIAIIFVGLDIFGLFGDNAGGNIAHLGGDLLGFLYATQLRKGNDIGKRFSSIYEWFSFRKKGNLKTVHKRKAYAGHTKKDFNEFNNQKKIDLILDKIGKSGYDSLTSEEKEFLFKSGK